MVILGMVYLGLYSISTWGPWWSPGVRNHGDTIAFLGDFGPAAPSSPGLASTAAPATPPSAPASPPLAPLAPLPGAGEVVDLKVTIDALSHWDWSGFRVWFDLT